MTFADLVAGDSVFVGANPLVYHCTIDPTWGPACTNLRDGAPSFRPTPGKKPCKWLAVKALDMRRR